MSLDIDLYELRDGQRHVLFSSNITHNLNKMAEAAGIYQAIWRPEEIFLDQPRAKDIEPYLYLGIKELASNPEKYKQFDAPNGWGTYEDLLRFLKEYYWACLMTPEAFIEACR